MKKRTKIARQAELRDLFWGERRAYRAGEYATEEEYEAGMDRTIALCAELTRLSTELKRVGFVPPPHRDEPTDADMEAALRTLQRLEDAIREARNRRELDAAPPPPPKEPQNEDTENEREEENWADRNS